MIDVIIYIWDTIVIRSEEKKIEDDVFLPLFAVFNVSTWTNNWCVPYLEALQTIYC